MDLNQNAVLCAMHLVNVCFFAGMLQLKELADAIAEKLQDRVYVGAELHGKKDDGEHPCKILKVLEEGVDGHRYEVAWLDKNKSTIDKAEVSAKDLVQKKFPFSRNILKSFIRESTYRNAPWVIHDELARNYGISTDIPEELKGRAFFSNGLLICKKKRKNEVNRKLGVQVSAFIHLSDPCINKQFLIDEGERYSKHCRIECPEV